MRVAMFSAKSYDRQSFETPIRESEHEIVYLEPQLNVHTVSLANGFDAACVFVNDRVDREVIRGLAEGGTRLIVLRCAGFNNVDLEAAADAGITVARVPAYSPHAPAEHAVALLMALNRKIHRAHTRVREGNFELRGLLGFDLHGKTVGVEHCRGRPGRQKSLRLDHG